MSRRLNAMLRRIESSLEALDKPTRCQNDTMGQGRTISPTAKNRELENLVQKVAECQQLVDNDSDQEWLNGVKETLKTRIELLLNPKIVELEG